MELAGLLAQRETFPFEWCAAKAIATRPKHDAEAEIAKSWDFLSERGDAATIVQWSRLLRHVGLLRYGDFACASDPDVISSCARRLIAEVERD